MKLLFFLLFIAIGCDGIKWKKINDFKETFQEYDKSAKKNIVSIKNIFSNSRNEATSFVTGLYVIPIMRRLEDSAYNSQDHSIKNRCLNNYISRDAMQFEYDMQLFQLEYPLMNRITDIQERVNGVNSTIDYYQGLADSKYWGCQTSNRSCILETENWLESIVDSLSCTMYDCTKHSIKKRNADNFNCNNGYNTVSRNLLCDETCHCNDCSDEKPGCARTCDEFHCEDTRRCIQKRLKCDGVDDCGDGSDEENCPLTTTTTELPQYTTANCSIERGDFMCDIKTCITLEKVCNGFTDCEDGSDESAKCQELCSSECEKNAGFCLRGPKGPECFYECPPGTYETSTGCSKVPEVAPPTLSRLLDDTPRLISRYATRVKFLKTKTTTEIYKFVLEIIKCNERRYTSLSKVLPLFSKDISHLVSTATKKTTTELGTTEVDMPAAA